MYNKMEINVSGRAYVSVGARKITIFIGDFAFRDNKLEVSGPLTESPASREIIIHRRDDIVQVSAKDSATLVLDKDVCSSNRPVHANVWDRGSILFSGPVDQLIAYARAGGTIHGFLTPVSNLLATADGTKARIHGFVVSTSVTACGTNCGEISVRTLPGASIIQAATNGGTVTVNEITPR